jgi:peptidoglycan/xylan/chitin deacetylase (PgdA/CDA1 family)
MQQAGTESAARQVAILGYHKVGPPPGEWETWFYIPEQVFAAQLTCLQAHDWECIDLETFMRGLREPDALPAKSALLTFDDGYRSMLHSALPVLQRFRCPAVLFIPTDYVGDWNRFDGGAEPDEPICDWNELRQLQDQRVAVQSHSVSHRAFSTLSPAEIEAEAGRSKCLIEERLQRPVELFSFPFGDAGQDPVATVAILRQAGYQAACLYGGGPVSLPAADPCLLSRIAMGPDTDLHMALTRYG